MLGTTSADLHLYRIEEFAKIESGWLWAGGFDHVDVDVVVRGGGFAGSGCCGGAWNLYRDVRRFPHSRTAGGGAGSAVRKGRFYRFTGLGFTASERITTGDEFGI
jgi:hypothetical protein